MNDLPYKVIPARPSDAPFVLDSWLKNYRRSLWVRDVDNATFYSEHKQLIERLLLHPRTDAFVAVWDKDADEAYGWIVGEPGGIIHYAYVKGAFRKLGIGRALLSRMGWKPGETIAATHRTWIAEPGGFLPRKLNVRYDPYLAYKTAYQST